MHPTLPPISESAEQLLELLRKEDGPRRLRVQALYLLASGQARSRSQVARLLGVHRNTVHAWLASYATGGLSAMLTIGQAPGRASALSAAQLERLRTALAQPAGFASYGAVRDWIEQELGVVMQYAAVHKLVRYQLGAKLKRARPSHVKKTPKP